MNNHELSWTPTHKAWRNMKYRCNTSSCPDFKNYGGRGITYDQRWESFDGFLADMGHAPHKKTLDRKDNDGPYCKDNCRWATRKEQANNQRKTILLTFEGRTQGLAAWAKEKGLSYTMLYTRYRKYGANSALLFGV